MPHFNDGEKIKMSIEKLLKEWNGGVLRGAKKALADKLGVPDTSVSHWIAKRAKPSEKHIKKVVRLFGVSEEEVQDSFEKSDASVESSSEVMFIPVLGISSATDEKFILEELESYLPINKSSKKQFAVRVEGNCMVDPEDPQNSIYHGNYIIVDPESDSTDGDVVLARIDGEYSTIKRYFPKGDIVKLIPDNPKYDPIIEEIGKVEIIGKVVNVYRPIKKKKERI